VGLDCSVSKVGRAFTTRRQATLAFRGEATRATAAQRALRRATLAREPPARTAPRSRRRAGAAAGQGRVRRRRASLERLPAPHPGVTPRLRSRPSASTGGGEERLARQPAGSRLCSATGHCCPI